MAHPAVIAPSVIRVPERILLPWDLSISCTKKGVQSHAALVPLNLHIFFHIGVKNILSNGNLVMQLVEN